MRFHIPVFETPAAAGGLRIHFGDMAASLYIVVEGEDPGYDTFVNGRALARNEDALERLAVNLGSRPLIEFFSADENSMALLVEEGAGDPSLLNKLPPPQWFPARTGLETVLALLGHLELEPTALGSESEMVRDELEEYATVLRKAVERNLRWHLSVSWR